MNSFVNAVTNTPTMARTQNGALTLKSSLDACVDLFFLIGSSRKNPTQVIPVFEKAFAENPEVALRVLLWSRDAREGAGERDIFRTVVKAQAETNTAFRVYFESILRKVPDLGRWDDLYEMIGSEADDVIVDMFVKAMKEKNGLAAKWTPRQGPVAIFLRQKMGLSPKQFRKMVVKLSSTVEQKMCAKDWSNINFNHVPSVAAKNYQKAFSKNDEARYKAYRNGLVKQVLTGQVDPSIGPLKVNASVVYPHEIVRQIRGHAYGDPGMMLAQWASLPDWIADGEGLLPVVDVSGSMNAPVSDGKTNRMDVSIGLGLYIADKQKGAFKDMVLTFSSRSSIEVLRGNIQQKVAQLETMHWEMSTNLQSSFNAILEVAVKSRIPQAEMPKVLLIISDMEFDACVQDRTNLDVAREKFRRCGYTLPQVVFWNVAGRPGNVPAKAYDRGVALVSGFSPSILSSILASGGNMTPRGVMLKKVMNQRYDLPEFQG